MPEVRVATEKAYMPVLSFDSLDAVPEGLREVAKTDEASGKVTVNVVAASKIDEFRDNNIKLSQERDGLASQLAPLKGLLGEFDYDAFKADLDDARLTRQRVKDGELKESRGIAEEVQKRTEEMRKSYEDQLQAKGREGAAWKTQAEQRDGQLKQQYVVNAIKDAASNSELGVVPSAIADVTHRALAIFKAGDDGKITPYAGDAPIYGADGVSPMSPHEWLEKLRVEAPHFFKGTNGGGSNGGQGEKKIHLGGKMSTQDLANIKDPRQRLAAINGEPGARL